MKDTAPPPCVIDTADDCACIVGTYGAEPGFGDHIGGRWHIGRALLLGEPGAVIYHKQHEADEWEQVAVLPWRVLRYAVEQAVAQFNYPLIPDDGHPLTPPQADAARAMLRDRNQERKALIANNQRLRAEIQRLAATV